MADSKTRKLNAKTLQDDLDSFAAVKAVSGYTPSNPEYKIDNGTVARDAMEAAQVKEVQDYATWQASRDGATAAEWAFHEYVLGTKVQIKAQFGVNSNEVQAIGLKKKNEYKSKSTKKPTP